jgi:hypothetical protein
VGLVTPSAGEDLRIIKVDLLNESFKTYRVLNDIKSIRYPVLVLLSRPVDDFERLYVEQAGILIDDNDAMRGLIQETTLEELRSQLHVLNRKLEMAVRDARQGREPAEAEDQRLIALVEEINAGLQPRWFRHPS